MSYRKRRFPCALVVSAVSACLLAPVLKAHETAEPPMAAMDHAAIQSQASASPVTAESAAENAPMFSTHDIRRTVVSYAVPALKMVRDDGAAVWLDKELNDGRPVVLNFVYTSCTTICPMGSQEFDRLQQRLGPDRDKVHLVSISIDPEQDTPAHLRDYARHFHAGKGWQYYTGTVASSVKAQQAFQVYRGDKMSHNPVTLVRAVAGGDWVRFDGFVGADDLYAELHTELRDLRATR
jgi:protein SCO1/2